MPRAAEPYTPETDLAARRAVGATGGASGVLTGELEAFCQSGVSVMVAACSPGEVPVVGLGCGSRMLADGRMRVLLMRSRNEGLIAMVERGGNLAATFTRPYTHRSIQVKGSEATLASPSPQDRLAAVAQCDGLRRELIEVGYPPGFSGAFCQIDAEDVVAIDLVIASAFVQTPGPGAGAELKP
jgi:hypothetical protein